MTQKKLFDDKYIGYHTFGLKINCKQKEQDTKHDYSKDYFTIEALEDGNVFFKYLEFASTKNQHYMEYSKDNGQTWTRTTNVEKGEVVMTIPLTTGEKALVRGINETLTAHNALTAHNVGEDVDFNSNFYSDIQFNVYGNIMSLIHGDAFIGKTIISRYMFGNLFFDYWGQFNSSQNSCNVVDASNLILPATTLAEHCYQYMFTGCTMLTSAPELPATTLASWCYDGMFMGCDNLNYIKAMFTTTPSNSYTNRWVDGVSKTGTFVKNSAAEWQAIGNNAVPKGWTIQTADE